MDGAYRATARERCRSKPVLGRPYGANLIRPAVIRRVAEVSNALRAASAFLEAVADVLRQLLYVVGWLALLLGIVELLISPHETFARFTEPFSSFGLAGLKNVNGFGEVAGAPGAAA